MCFVPGINNTFLVERIEYIPKLNTEYYSFRIGLNFSVPFVLSDFNILLFINYYCTCMQYS